MLIIDREAPVARVVTDYPFASRVLSRHRIDFCCGGRTPLKTVCEKKGVDVEALIEEIKREGEIQDDPVPTWGGRPLPELIDHILVAYHRPLDEDLPRLEELARKVARVHGDKDSRLIELMETFTGFRVELEQHMAKEEQILFPMIKSGQGELAQGPVSCMESEHDDAGKALAKFRSLTDEYSVPETACNSWRALLNGLERFEKTMHNHVHLENNILFPRALEGR